MQRHDQFNFVMQLLRGWRVNQIRATLFQGICRLGEEDWWLTPRVPPHLAHVVRVIAPYAEDPSHGKAQFAVPDLGADTRGWGEYIAWGHGTSVPATVAGETGR
jgi:hypothetical protein